MNALIKASIQNRSITLFAVVIIFIIGINSLFTIPQNEDPKIEVRMVQIVTYWPGATPEDVELYVTKPLEKACSVLDDLDTISSESIPGTSIVYVSISKYIPPEQVRPAMQQIRNYVMDTVGSLPNDIQGPFINDRFGETDAFVVGIASKDRTRRELEAIVEQMEERIKIIDGVGETKIIGNVPEKIYVEGSINYLSKLGISPDNLYTAIKEQNIQIAQPYIRISGKKLLIEVTGTYKAVDQIKETVVYTDDKSRMYKLKDLLGEVNVAYEDPITQKARSNKMNTVVLTIAMRRGKNITEWGATVQKELEKMKTDLPADVEMIMLSNQPRGVEKAVDSFMENFYEAVGIVLLVLGIGVGIRNGLIVAVAIPLIILSTFSIMQYVLKTELQQMSINALIIALGMLVDNCVVVTDNIKRFMDMGYKKEDAAYLGAKELIVALFSATATTLAAFIPLALMPGSTGEYIKDIPNVISVCLLLSYFVAMFVTPAMAVMFLPSTEQMFENKKNKKIGFFGRMLASIGTKLSNIYYRIIDFTLKFKYLVVFLIIGIIVFTCYVAVTEIPISFFPPAEKTQFVIDLWLPEGYELKATEEKAKLIESELMKLKEQGVIENYVVYLGFGGPRFFIAISPVAPREYYSQFVINTKDPKMTEKAIKHLIPFTKQIPGARIDVKTLMTGPVVDTPIEVRVSGKDIDLLREYGQQIKDILARTPGVTTIQDSFGVDSDKIVVHVNQDRAKLLGLSSEDIATGFYIFFEGYPISKMKSPERQIDIVMRLRDTERQNLDDVKALKFTSRNTGKQHRLDEFATLSLEKDLSVIKRYKLTRINVLGAQIRGRLASEVLKDAQKEINKLELKEGYKIEYGGENQESDEAFGDLLPLAVLALLVLWFILALQFKSLRIASAIYFTLPLGMVGAVAGMIIMKQPLGFMSALGLISLTGIVVNNAIIMIEFTMDKMREGHDVGEAIKESGVIRFRPIMLTTISTLGGLLPLALFGGVLFQPMCWVIIFGLSVSTILTLIVVPLYFVIMGGATDAARIIANEKIKDTDLKPVVDVEAIEKEREEITRQEKENKAGNRDENNGEKEE